ncbi:hypothetical protein F4779DRAFT_609227 [Xylariaceae sp. FL0662B]|nr:hypothetical protein F4779DRAFT_609227 [Xylariaceae sp. FL0662B]
MESQLTTGTLSRTSTVTGPGTTYLVITLYNWPKPGEPPHPPYLAGTTTMPLPLSTTPVDSSSVPTTSDMESSLTSQQLASSSQQPASSSQQLISTPTSRPSDAESGLNGGAIAGIAVACAVVGFSIGVGIAYCLLRRWKRHEITPEYVSVGYAGKEKDLPARPIVDKLQLDQFLLDPKSDAEIGTELRSLGYLVQQHVENNYHLQLVHCSENDLVKALTHLGLDRGIEIPAAQLASMALDPNKRYSTLRHVIARVAFASVTFGEEPPISLLPPLLSLFPSMIPPTENHRGNPGAVLIGLTRWRQLSAFLLHPHRSDRTPLIPSEDVSTHQAQKLALTLNTFLEPFVAGSRDERYEQENHLREVIVECATFGYVLLSQPSEYRLRFDQAGGLSSIVVCPGLDKISNEEGHRYPRPAQPIVAPVVDNY